MLIIVTQSKNIEKNSNIKCKWGKLLLSKTKLEEISVIRKKNSILYMAFTGPCLQSSEWHGGCADLTNTVYAQSRLAWQYREVNCPFWQRDVIPP